MDFKIVVVVDEKEVLWCVNFEEFLWKLRYQVMSLNFFFSLMIEYMKYVFMEGIIKWKVYC